ncbi:MAG TPA: HD domain-containing protein [Roseiarcus sp.]|jgi:hypothetical protein
MQRLRRIKQLGFSEFVYPSATHTRFSHVVGALQMARRMLQVLQRNQSLGDSEDTKLDITATLAAALLHDIGHGPYSHVFEEISEHFQITDSHEDYTKALIESEEIAGILRNYGVFERIKRFFDKEPGYSVFNAVISSQMDCDRLDFLCRDRYHTGIRSATIDLEWLFDSLVIDKVEKDDRGEVKEYSFVFKEKGLVVVEEFVLAYISMYRNVYFHKATRAVQHLVRDMLIDLVDHHSDESQVKDLPIVQYFLKKIDPINDKLNLYLELDDLSIIELMKISARNHWGLASDLARRFFARDLYKCFELQNTEGGNVPRRKLERFRGALRENGIYFVEDILAHRSYKQYAVTDANFLKNILVSKDHEIEPLGSISDILKVPPKRIARIYFRTSADRDAAIALYVTC